MKNAWILVGTCVSLAAVIACGDDDTSKDRDGGSDASVDSGESQAGRGGRGGTGGRAGTGGRGGSGGGSVAGEGGRGGGGAGGDQTNAGAGGKGGTGGSDMSTVAVGGKVSGLTGAGLVLQDNGGDDLTVTAAGDFKFATKLATGADYAVTVKTQPSNPSQTCTVTDGAGKLGSDDVDSVAVACTTNKYKVGGAINGLTGSGLVLKNNGGDSLNASGSSFEFGTSIDSGADYAVTVATQPSDQVCSLESGTGKVGAANVSVAVTCHAKNVLQVAPGFGNAVASWNDTGAASYTVKLTTSATCDLETTGCPGFAEIANATSPATVPSLTNGTPYYFQLTSNYPGDVKSVSNKTATRPNKPRANGVVYAVAAAASGITYAGGTFTRLSVHTGGAVPVHKSTGLPSEIPNFPIVDADVYSVASDGAGGYYIGGTFSAIGAVARAGVAHIKSDGTLDGAWDPGVSGGIVRAIAVHDTTVYIAGDFTMAGGVARAGLAAVGTNGTLVAGFNPAVTPTGTVSALTFVGTDLVAGGSFTAIGGGTQANLALLDGTTGMIKNWNPAADGAVNALAANGDIVYVGGEFSNIGGAARRAVAALNGTGAMAAQATIWNPAPDNAVTQVAFASNTVYIAGTFMNVGMPATARPGVAAIDAAGTGALKDWNPAITPARTVTTLAASEDTVYLAGSFTSVGGMPRNGAAAVSGSAAGALTSWDPTPDGIVEGFALSGNSVVVVGQHRGIGGLSRPRLAAFGATGDVTTWNPNANDEVYALATSGTQVYVGGAFTSLGGATRNHIGAVAENGTLDPTFNPNADVNAYAFAISGTTLYVGGGFTMIGGQARFAIAALNATSGAATAWNPGANNNVRALSLQGTTLYAGGEFTSFGSDSATRNHLASVLTTTDTASAWDPNITGTSVNALASTADTVYAGGNFTAVGMTARSYLAAINATTGVATAFAPEPTGIVHALLLDSGALYVGGEFLNISGMTFNHYAGYDNQSVFRMNYIYDFDFSVRALALGANAIYVGGDFQALNGQFASGFASVPK